MFEKRDDLLKFLSVAETGKISTAADRLGMTQPALSRVVVRLERQFGGRLFERLPTGVRLTALGTTAVDLARHVLREIEVAEEKMDAALSGRTGCFRVTAGPTWMQAVLPLAVPRFHESHPGIELKLTTTDFRRGLRLLADGRTDLPCGGGGTGGPPPARPAGAAAAVPEAGTAARRDVRHRCPRRSPAARKDGGSRRSRGLSVDRLRRADGTRYSRRPAFALRRAGRYPRENEPACENACPRRNGGFLPDGGRPLSLVGVAGVPGKDARAGAEASTS